MPRFVLEIGTEEIPPRYFPVALPHLAEAGKGMLERARLSHDEAKVYGTPRRLVFIAENLAAVQAPAVREERGPAAKIAFDAQGKPTKAAEGFARRWGITPDKLVRKQTDPSATLGTGQGEYVFAIITEPELPAVQALAPLLPGLITGIPFPKAMRWGSGALRFGRPIRWLLALVDDEVVEFELEGVKSGRLTRGHPVLAEGMFPISHAAEYEERLGERFVTVDDVERQKSIRGQLEAIARAQQADPVGVRWELPLDRAQRWMFPEWVLQQMTSSDGLLMQTTFLTEWPKLALGHFDASFLNLPRPVLIEEMCYVQCYFPLEDGQANLLPSFIAVRDGGEEHLDKVVAGWENVLRSKLIDARYFYEQDLKTPLADRVEALKGVVFQEKLGTMHGKMERIRAIARDLGTQLALDGGKTEVLEKAALLCKADLTTEMVTELSGLQGIMGREYALRSGEDADVADAIGEHYRPRFAGDSIPQSRLGQLLAIADKADSITACLAVGVTPTGSADPYGLRREAMGVVRILVEAERPLRLSVRNVVEGLLGTLCEQIAAQRPREEVVEEVMGFLGQRLQAYLSQGDPPFGRVRYDLVDAALAPGVDDIAAAAERARALGAVSGQSDFLPTVIACTRPINIIKGFEGGEVDGDLLREKGEPAEKALWEAYQSAKAEADGNAQTGDYEALFTTLGDLRDPIDTFFEKVLVMHEDEQIRRNRLALCWNINQNLFRRLADFSLIVQT